MLIFYCFLSFAVRLVLCVCVCVCIYSYLFCLLVCIYAFYSYFHVFSSPFLSRFMIILFFFNSFLLFPCCPTFCLFLTYHCFTSFPSTLSFSPSIFPSYPLLTLPSSHPHPPLPSSPLLPFLSLRFVTLQNPSPCTVLPFPPLPYHSCPFPCPSLPLACPPSTMPPLPSPPPSWSEAILDEKNNTSGFRG